LSYPLGYGPFPAGFRTRARNTRFPIARARRVHRRSRTVSGPNRASAARRSKIFRSPESEKAFQGSFPWKAFERKRWMSLPRASSPRRADKSHRFPSRQSTRARRPGTGSAANLL